LNQGEDLYREASRQFTVCNACRYCEGFCAVFPAIEKRLWGYDRGYIEYIANLCHDCRDCFYSCPYTPPNPFSINIPLLLSSIRLESYKKHTYPERLSKRLFERPIEYSIVATVASIALIALYAILSADPSRLFTEHTEPGSFYEVIPYGIIAIAGIALLAYIAIAFGLSMYRYWRSIGAPGGWDLATSLALAVWDALVHRYFRGGGAGCSYPGERPGLSRLYLHFSIFLGLGLATLATISAAIYQEILGILPPYNMLSLPVVLGTAGGALIVFGTTCLLYLKARSDRGLVDQRMARLDVYMLALLDLVAITGILTLALRETGYMGAVFTVHMGLVAALFVVAPYSKLIHMAYRLLSLAKYRYGARAGREV